MLTQLHATLCFMCACTNSHFWRSDTFRHALTFFRHTFRPVPATQFSIFSKFSTRGTMPHPFHTPIQNFKLFAHHLHPSSIFGTPTPPTFRPTYLWTGLSNPIFDFFQMFDWGSYAPPFPHPLAKFQVNSSSASPPTVFVA